MPVAASSLRARSGEGIGADLLEQCQRRPQLVTRIDPAALPTQPLAVHQTGPGGIGPRHRASSASARVYDASAASSSATSARHRASSPRDIGVSDATARSSRSTECRLGCGSSPRRGLRLRSCRGRRRDSGTGCPGNRGSPPRRRLRQRSPSRVRAPRSSTRRTAASNRDRVRPRTARPTRPPVAFSTSSPIQATASSSPTSIGDRPTAASSRDRSAKRVPASASDPATRSDSPSQMRPCESDSNAVRERAPHR